MSNGGGPYRSPRTGVSPLGKGEATMRKLILLPIFLLVSACAGARFMDVVEGSAREWVVLDDKAATSIP